MYRWQNRKWGKKGARRARGKQRSGFIMPSKQECAGRCAGGTERSHHLSLSSVLNIQLPCQLLRVDPLYSFASPMYFA